MRHLALSDFEITSENDAAGGVFFTFGEISEIFIANFIDFKQSAFFSYIWFLNFFRSVDDFGSWDSGDSVVIGFSDSSDDWDVFFDEEMDGVFRDSFFGDNDV